VSGFVGSTSSHSPKGLAGIVLGHVAHRRFFDESAQLEADIWPEVSGKAFVAIRIITCLTPNFADMLKPTYALQSFFLTFATTVSFKAERCYDFAFSAYLGIRR